MSTLRLSTGTLACTGRGGCVLRQWEARGGTCSDGSHATFFGFFLDLFIKDDVLIQQLRELSPDIDQKYI